MSKYWRYVHHGVEVYVRKTLYGKHREYCLCHACEKLNTEDQAKNCAIASAVYASCLKHHIVTPVWECPEFLPSGETK